MHKGFFVFFLLMFSLVLVSSAPPFQTSTATTGLEVRYPQYDVAKQNTDFDLHVHVYNLTNGLPITNATTSCFLHLYDIDGDQYLTMKMTFVPATFPIGEWETDILGTNFSTLGTHSYIIQCNSTTQGGFVSGNFLVTETGEIATNSQAILYSGLLILSIILLIGTLVLAFYINGDNEFSMGKLVEVNFNKYLKMGLFLLSYLFLTITMFFASEISTRFLVNSFATGILSTAHIVLWYLFVPLFILVVVVALIKFVADLNLQELSERGLKPYGT